MIRIGFTGDFCPWRRVEDEVKNGRYRDVTQGVEAFFSVNNLNVIDLEGPITTAQTGIMKTGPHIKAHPETAILLKQLHCDLVATANNHFKDYGWEGMQETYAVLQKQGIDWFGSGDSVDSASTVCYREIDSLRIALINVAENEWTTTHGAYPGCNPMDPVNVFHAIQEAKKKAEFIIVIAHGGHENYALPSPRMKKWYRYFVDCGAHAVIGHHTHIVSGFEIYKEAPIFYSLGNFCFDWEGLRNGTWNIGMLVRLKLERGKPVQSEQYFVRQCDDHPTVTFIEGEEKQALQDHVQQLNAVITDDAALEKAFDVYADSWNKQMNTWIQPYTGKLLPSLFNRGFLPALVSDKKKRLYLNLIRCEAHRDILLNSLKSDS